MPKSKVHKKKLHREFLPLQEKYVRYNDIKGGGAEQLAAAVLDSKLMEEFSLIPIKALRANGVTELKLSDKGLGPAEARVIGSLLTVSGSLTKLNVRYNKLDDEAKTLLRDAAKDKSGFELQL